MVTPLVANKLFEARSLYQIGLCCCWSVFCAVLSQNNLFFVNLRFGVGFGETSRLIKHELSLLHLWCRFFTDVIWWENIWWQVKWYQVRWWCFNSDYANSDLLGWWPHPPDHTQFFFFNFFFKKFSFQFFYFIFFLTFFFTFFFYFILLLSCK